MKNFQITKILLIIVIVLGGIYILSPEYLRNTIYYQFSDIDDYKIFDNRTVISAGHIPWQEDQGFDNRVIAPGYEEVLDQYKTTAFLVIKNEKIVFEKYWDDYNRETRSGGFSMTKSIIGLLVGIAIDQGSIKSVDQPVGDFIGKFTQGDLAKVNIRHLLEMSSGLSWEDTYSNPFGKTAQAYYGDDLPKLVLDQYAAEAPGVNFDYKNANTQILALVLEKATGLSVSAYTSINLWKPMGASDDALWSLDEVNGVEKAFCGFNTNARDYARFGQLILNKGSWKGDQLVPAGYLDSAVKPADHLIDKDGNQVDYYGWHWWIHQHNGLQVYSMRGFKGQYVFAIPEKNIVIVRLGHKASKEMIGQFSPSDIPTWIEIGLAMAE